jgi:hypothetical protein
MHRGGAVADCGDVKGPRVQGREGSSDHNNRVGRESDMLNSYKDLKVWQKSYQLCLEIYKITKEFPREERYGLTSQMRRAVLHS